MRLDDIRQELVEGPVTVYNLQVEEFHTYYAGALSVLVHNANYPEDVNGMQERSQAGQEAEGGAGQKPTASGTNAKPTFMSDEKILSHFEKHGGEFRGTFDSADDYLKAAQDVMQNGYKVEFVTVKI